METGVVKWFDREKGFGFIARPSGKDLFVHFSEIKTKGFKTLEVGQHVKYQVSERVRGLIATDVEVISE